MPIEFRRIVLDDDELILALRAFRRVRKELLPQGEILDVKPADDGGITIRVESPMPADDNVTTVTLPTKYLVSAMVRFCIENNIVIPRQGKRSAGHTTKGWALEMLLTGAELEHTGLVADDGVQDVQIGVAGGN